MPSGWERYYVLILSSLLALGIPLSLAVLSQIFSEPRHKKQQDQTKNMFVNLDLKHTQLGKKINTRFFMGAIFAHLLIVLVLILIPCVAIISFYSAQGAVVVVSALALLGVIYSVRKGDLAWLETLRKKENDTTKGDAPLE